jgi:lysophospholipase L1-like esterase
MIGLLAAAPLLAALGSGCDGALCNAQSLAPFFAKLAHAKGRAGMPVHILQIGDSHTAGDQLTGAWRDILQARYGSGGRGVLPPGRPYDGYTTRGVTARMSPGWAIAADFGVGWSSENPPLGLSAFSATSQQDGATMTIEAEPAQAFNRFTVCALAKAGAGKLALRAGTVAVDFDLDSVTERPQCRTLRSDAPTTGADITATGQVTITSWATFADQGGVAVSNVGVVGSQLVHFSRTDDSVLAEELREYRPDLIVIAFGTNEGFNPRFTPFEYDIILRTQIGRLRRLAGNVPVLLLGAPDALTRRAELRANTPGGVGVDCGVPAAAPAPPATSGVIDSIMTALRDMVGAEQPAPTVVPAPAAAPPPPAAAAAPVRPGLFPPPALAAVRDVQSRVARSLNVAFWDWEAREGGRCTALDWARRTPPLMRGDYVHYTRDGGRELAQRLEADLDRAMAK